MHEEGTIIIEPVRKTVDAETFSATVNEVLGDYSKTLKTLATALVFLKLNRLQPAPDGPQWEPLVLDVASGTLEREQVTAHLRASMLAS